MKIDLKDTDTQAIIFASFFVIAAIGGIIHYLRSDKDLRNKERLEQIEMDFENEFKKIRNPPKTAVNNFESGKNYSSFIYASTRYRTELSQNEFEAYFKEQLKKQGWAFYGENNNFDHKLSFCKGKFDARLSYETGAGWKNNAYYYLLSFSSGQRSSIQSNEPLPRSCW